MVLEQADKSDMAEGTEATVEADQEPPTISVTEDTPASSEPDVEITTEEPEVEEELPKADEDKPQVLFLKDSINIIIFAYLLTRCMWIEMGRHLLVEITLKWPFVIGLNLLTNCSVGYPIWSSNTRK